MFNWVVNEPDQALDVPASRIVPNAVKEIPVSPLPRLVRRNGEPATAMQVCPVVVLAQLVPLVVAGDVNPSKTKSRVVPENVMKSSTMPPGLRSAILPATPGPSIPPEYVRSEERRVGRGGGNEWGA